MSWLTDLLKEYPTVAVAKERLALIEDKLKKTESDKRDLENEVVALKTRITDLEGKNAELRGEVVKLMKSNSFIEYDGTLWKREADGTVKPIAYCPKCQLAMAKEYMRHVVDKVKCSICQYTAPFATSRIAEIAKELSAN